MSVVVVSTNADDGDFFASRMLPHTPRIARGADRVYRFYQTDIERDCALTDLHGEPLVEVHAFQRLADADAWFGTQDTPAVICNMPSDANVA